MKHDYWVAQNWWWESQSPDLLWLYRTSECFNKLLIINRMGAVAAADGWLGNGIWMYVHRWWWWDAMRCDDAEGYLNNNRKRKVVAFVRTSFLTARSFLLNMHVNFYSKNLFFNSSSFIFCSPRIFSIIDTILHFSLFHSAEEDRWWSVRSCWVCKTSELSSQSLRLRDCFLCGCQRPTSIGNG